MYSMPLCSSDCVQACKGALQKLGPLMKSDKINAMFQKHCDPEEQLLYADFLNDLCKLIVSDSFYVLFAYFGIFFLEPISCV